VKSVIRTAKVDVSALDVETKEPTPTVTQ
jgi:hypothetical protein